MTLSAPIVSSSTTSLYDTSKDKHIAIIEIELGKPLPTLYAIDETTGQRYQYAHCLLRLHTTPLGIIEFAFHDDELTPQDYCETIWQELADSINAHLRSDDLSPVSQLEGNGIVYSGVPACIKEREAFYEVAPFVSIVVSTHDRPEYVATCLPPMFALHYPRYEVVLIDNAPSNSATEDIVKQYKDETKLRYIREDHPGLSVGLNRGIAEAQGELIAFTDDDVIVDRYWLLQLVRSFYRAEDVQCVTGLVLAQELETPAQVLFEEFGGFSKGFERHIYTMKSRQRKEPLYPYTAGRFGTGANMAFRASFLRRIGGFDTALTCGMDIATFFLTVRTGHTLVYEPEALVYHTHRRSYASLQRQIYSYGVAVTAYLTKCIIARPHLLLEIMARVPAGLFFILSSQSSKNQKKSAHYPKDLTQCELRGLLHGPFDYIQKRVRHVMTREGRYNPIRQTE